MLRFFRAVAQDLLLWAIIYFGLYLHIEWVENIAIAYIWFIIAMLCIAGLMSQNKQLVESIKKKGRRLWIHKQWVRVTCVAECAVIFALGYFWMGAFYVIGCLLAQALYNEVEKE